MGKSLTVAGYILILLVLGILLCEAFPWRWETVLRPVHEQKVKTIIIEEDGKPRSIEIPQDDVRMVWHQQRHAPTMQEACIWVFIGLFVVYYLLALANQFSPPKFSIPLDRLSDQTKEFRIFAWGVVAYALGITHQLPNAFPGSAAHSSEFQAAAPVEPLNGLRHVDPPKDGQRPPLFVPDDQETGSQQRTILPGPEEAGVNDSDK